MIDGRLQKFLAGFVGATFIMSALIAAVYIGFWLVSQSPLYGIAMVVMLIAGAAGLDHAFPKAKGDER